MMNLSSRRRHAELDTLRSLVVDGMEHAAALSVPLLVDIGVGDNWLDTKTH